MATILGEINLFAVLVGAIVSIGIGMLWYSPILFGNVWLRLIGKSADEIEGAGPAMGLAALAAVISSLVLAMMVQAVGAATLLEGLVVGIVVWVGIGATATLVVTVYEGPPLSVWLLNAGYQLIVYAVQGAIFAMWQ